MVPFKFKPKFYWNSDWCEVSFSKGPRSNNVYETSLQIQTTQPILKTSFQDFQQHIKAFLIRISLKCLYLSSLFLQAWSAIHDPIIDLWSNFLLIIHTSSTSSLLLWNALPENSSGILQGTLYLWMDFLEKRYIATLLKNVDEIMPSYRCKISHILKE
jgi:hypothetical protein